MRAEVSDQSVRLVLQAYWCALSSVPCVLFNMSSMLKFKVGVCRKANFGRRCSQGGDSSDGLGDVFSGCFVSGCFGQGEVCFQLMDFIF